MGRPITTRTDALERFMTTGSITWGSKTRHDSRAGVGWTGEVCSKSWTGLDRPPSYTADAKDRLGHYASRSARKRLENEPHPYQMTYTKEVSPVITVQPYIYGGIYYGWWSGGPSYETTVPAAFGRGATPADPWTSNDDLQLLSNLKDQVYGGSANMAVTIAEMRETVSTLGQLAKGVSKLLHHAVTFESLTGRQRKRYAQNFVRRVSRNLPIRKTGDYWLAWRYAIRPALMDIDQQCQMLANINNRPQTNRFRARHMQKDGGTWNGGAAEIVHEAAAIVFVTTKASELLVWSGISDPASVLWEKIPYSFVIDWMYPVGNFLAAVDFWRKTEGSFVFTHKVTRTVNGCFGTRGDVVVSGGGGYSYTQINMHRSVTSNPAIPYPSLNLEVHRSKLALKRTLDAVALFGLPRRL